MRIAVTDYLSWERSNHPDAVNSPAPVTLMQAIPSWFTELKGELKHYTTEWKYSEHTARHCLGLRGAMNIGYTIPWAKDYQQRRLVKLHPAQITGSIWSEKNAHGQYIWDLYIVSYPWRARMAPGWRMLINSHPLSWSNDWFEFSGSVDSDYRLNHNQNSLTGLWDYDQDLDSSYCYYQVETVMAFRVDDQGKPKIYSVQPGTPVFSLVPVFQPS